jgi:hypothetical protein
MTHVTIHAVTLAIQQSLKNAVRLQVWNMTNDDGDLDPMVCGGMQEFDKGFLLRGGTSREEQF